MTKINIPNRFVATSALRDEFHDLIDVFGSNLLIGDPLADQLVSKLEEFPDCNKMINQAILGGIASVKNPFKELIDFFEIVEQVPSWVNWDELNFGGAALLRGGLNTIFILNFCSLPLFYSLPGANKPLIETQQLINKSYKLNRLFNTGLHFYEVCKSHGLQVGHPGYALTIQVRLQHASIRLKLLKNNWSVKDWGVPINQTDMALTNLTLSTAVIQKLERAGYLLSQKEKEAITQLWRYQGILMGIDPELCPSNFQQANEWMRAIFAINKNPDADSITLTNALFDPELLQYMPGGNFFKKYPDKALSFLKAVFIFFKWN